MVPAVAGQTRQGVDVLQLQTKGRELQQPFAVGGEAVHERLHVLPVLGTRPGDRTVAGPALPHPGIVRREVLADGEDLRIIGLPAVISSPDAM